MRIKCQNIVFLNDSLVAEEGVQVDNSDSKLYRFHIICNLSNGKPELNPCVLGVIEAEMTFKIKNTIYKVIFNYKKERDFLNDYFNNLNLNNLEHKQACIGFGHW